MASCAVWNKGIDLAVPLERNASIHSGPKFSRTPETDARVEVKKPVEANVLCLFLNFQRGQLLIFLLELMAIRPWPTWHQAGVWEGGGAGGWQASGSAGRWLHEGQWLPEGRRRRQRWLRRRRRSNQERDYETLEENAVKMRRQTSG